MTARLAKAERAALAALRSAPEGDAVLEAHRRWLDARRSIQASLAREHGLPVEHWTPLGSVVYSLDASGRLHAVTTPSARGGA